MDLNWVLKSVQGIGNSYRDGTGSVDWFAIGKRSFGTFLVGSVASVGVRLTRHPCFMWSQFICLLKWPV